MNDRSGHVSARLLGDDAVFRGGYTRAFNRAGMNDFSGQYGANPGVTIQNPDRSLNHGNLNNDGTACLCSSGSPAGLDPRRFPSSPIYPLTDVVTEDINLFDPRITVPYADTWTVGIQRAVGTNFAVEARYVGTRSRENWSTINYNETNIFENGFLNEFRVAQANLRANIAAGRGGTFAYTGAPGTAPLPMTFAFFHGTTGRQEQPRVVHVDELHEQHVPDAAGDLQPQSDRVCRTASTATAGPAARAPRPLASRRTSSLRIPTCRAAPTSRQTWARTEFHGLQLELRRRYAQGLQFQASYAFGQSDDEQFPELPPADCHAP